MSKIEIKKYSPDLQGIFKKYINENFHDKYILGDEKYINWQYGGSLFVAYAGGKIVGHFGCRDIEYKIRNKTKLTRILMNLSVVESYRMAGIAPLLVEKVFDTENPILVSDARPAAHQLFSHFRGNWKELGNLKRYFGILNPENKIVKDFKPTEIINNKSEAHDFKIEFNSKITEQEVNFFWQKVRDRYPITIERTFKYLNWRFFKHPFFNYQTLVARQNSSINGYLIWRLEKSEGVTIARIIDCIALKQADSVLLDVFIEQAKKAGADILDFFNSGNFYDELLEKRNWFNVEGTKFKDFPILFSPLSFRRSSINIECDFEVDLSDGYFTKADGDQDRPNPY